MGFDLYSAGAGSKNVLDLKRRLNYDQLLSQLNERKACIEWAEYKRAHPECTSKLFIDSGAYTAHTKGKEVDVDEYISFINSIDDQVYIFAQVDKIPGVWGQPKTPEQLAEAPILSWENYKYMVTKVKSPKKLLPIFHQGEDFKYLQQMLDYVYPDTVLDKSCVGQHIDYIGISCNKELSTGEWIDWFSICFKMIRDSDNPNVKTHAFGMTSLKVLEQFPFTSADSTSWVRSAGFGNILIDYTSVYTSSRNRGDSGYIQNLSPAVQQSIDNIAKRYGYTLFEIIDEATTEERKVLLDKLTEIFKKYQSDYDKIGIKVEIPKYDGAYIYQIKEKFLSDSISACSAYIKTSTNDEVNNKIKATLGVLSQELDDLNSSGEIRCLFNICSLKEWANKYKYSGTDEYEESLW